MSREWEGRGGRRKGEGDWDAKREKPKTRQKLKRRKGKRRRKANRRERRKVVSGGRGRRGGEVVDAKA